MSTFNRSKFLLDLHILEYQKKENLATLMFKLLNLKGLEKEDFYYVSSILEYPDEWAEFHYGLYNRPIST